MATEEELVLFRIAQKALNNIRWHSRASQARVRLAFQLEADAGTTVVTDVPVHPRPWDEGSSSEQANLP